MTAQTPALSDFVGRAPAIYCNECGLAEVDVMAIDDRDAAVTFTSRGWVVRMDTDLGYPGSVCKSCDNQDAS